MLNKEKQNILDNNYFLNKVKDGRKKIRFDKDGTFVFIVAFFVSLFIIVTLYMLSPFSKTSAIIVTGNHYLKDEDIIEKANLNKYFLLTTPNLKANSLKEDVLIEDVKISMLNNNTVSIEVKETKQIGYIFEDDTSKLLLIDDNRVLLTKDNMYLINNVPLIAGYSKEELTKIEKDFEDVDYKIINEISDIHKYPVSYDDTHMEVIMRDGNYCFLSSSSLKLLENYYSVSSAIDSSKGEACAFFDDLTNSAYISSCPWQQETEEENDTEQEENDAEQDDDIEQD